VNGSLRENLVLILLVEIFKDVDRVVGIEFLHRLRDLLVRHRVDDVFADRVVDFGQRGKVEIRAEQIRPAPCRCSGCSASSRSPSSDWCRSPTSA
jgi:hypothetical protein